MPDQFAPFALTWLSTGRQSFLENGQYKIETRAAADAAIRGLRSGLLAPCGDDTQRGDRRTQLRGAALGVAALSDRADQSLTWDEPYKCQHEMSRHTFR